MAARTGSAEGRKYRGISPIQRRAERRAKLIEAGIHIFGSQGFHAATVKQICSTARLTERYFYESFENLNALFGAAYDHQLERLRDTMVQALAGAPRNVEAMAETLLRAYYNILQREPLLARILLIEIYGTTQDMNRLYQRGVLDFAQLVRGIIQANFRLERQDGLDAGLISTAVIGAAIHLGTGWYLSGYRESLETMVTNSHAIITAVTEKLTTRMPQAG
ncbi:MAG: TetR/AcrR family transcriptional regulator [Nevskiales bacterium]